ncbi:MAG: dimethylsulfonioproprionate lyase family protein [Pseudomonadota bacterium]
MLDEEGDWPEARLADRPGWAYLLRDMYEFYRFLPAGGSKAIRGHQREVRERISRVLTVNPRVLIRPPAEKPVTLHLRRALQNGLNERHARFIRVLDGITPELSWQYGYDRVPRGLAKKYAYAEFAGPQGPIVTDEVILGLVLFAPNCTYPSHAHDGITESYICLSGAVSENDQGVYAPGSLIFNPPGTMHRITTASREPSLLCYAWSGPPEKLGSQKMKFTRGSRRA